MDYICYVCGDLIDLDSPHTYHAEGCPVREDSVGCVDLSGCGEDVHPECCPICTGQAF